MKVDLLIYLILIFNTQIESIEFTKNEYKLASIISGEVGTLCGIEGMIAVAHIYKNNKNFYGNKNPEIIHLLISKYYNNLKDTSYNANYLFSKEDLSKPSVQKIIKEKKLTTIINCKYTYQLYAYK